MSVDYSFVTTNYNKNDVLDGSVRSILDVMDAVDGACELVVVDGGSDDGSISTLERLCDEDARIRLTVTPCNLGEGRRLAFRAARGRVVIQHVDTDREYAPEVAEAVGLYDRLSARDPDLVLATFDSLYLSTADVASAEWWPTTDRVEERVFVDRAMGATTVRVCPVSFSRELPTVDTANPRSRARKWVLQSRDMARVGFSYATLVKFNHRTFSLPKALMSDALGAAGYYLATRHEPVPVAHRELLRHPESWQTDAMANFPDLFVAPPAGLDEFRTTPG